MITEMHMPGRTGIELLKAVKVRYANVAVVVMTADADVKLRGEARAFGAAAFLEKPFDALNLLEVIAACLGSRAPHA
jgi:FixJ family two-component response regulator